jgi:hypothetical protein
MRKKNFLGIAMSLFAVATVINTNLVQKNNAGDISLECISIMAQASNEGQTVPGWTNNDKAHGYICNIPGGMCDVSQQIPQ